MKKQFFASLLAGAVLAFAGVAAHAQDTLKFGVADEPYPPFSSKDASGKWVGFEVDLMDALCTQMKAKCELVPVAWEGIIPALQEKKIDVIFSSMSITEKRKQVIDFSDKYYQTPGMFIGAKATKVDLCPETGICKDWMKGKVIGVQVSTTHAAYAQKAFGDVAEIKTYDKQDNANADLVAGRLDIALADSVALLDFLNSDQGKDLEKKALAPADPIFGEGVGAGVRKEDTALRQKINAAIKAVRDDGTYKKLNDKYFNFDVYGAPAS
ncbi:MAG TPA: transporter substrate-binding domain-containing protein [Candidatus Acidoferrum sp.]|nr:transporter substrate-binding domain-containing protein [Candidatus Acidoferrum sp.]